MHTVSPKTAVVFLGQEYFQIMGFCRRYQMVYIDQNTAQKNEEPFCALLRPQVAPVRLARYHRHLPTLTARARQKIEAKEPEKNIPSTAAKATRRNNSLSLRRHRNQTANTGSSITVQNEIQLNIVLIYRRPCRRPQATSHDTTATFTAKTTYPTYERPIRD